jgi:hypothetical protein
VYVCALNVLDGVLTHRVTHGCSSEDHTLRIPDLSVVLRADILLAADVMVISPMEQDRQAPAEVGTPLMSTEIAMLGSEALYSDTRPDFAMHSQLQHLLAHAELTELLCQHPPPPISPALDLLQL